MSNILSLSNNVKLNKNNVDNLNESVYCVKYFDSTNTYTTSTYTQINVTLWEAFFSIINKEYFKFDNNKINCVKNGTYLINMSFESGKESFVTTFGSVINNQNQQNTHHYVTHNFTTDEINQRANYSDVLKLNVGDTLTLGVMPIGTGTVKNIKIDIVYLC